MAVVSSRNLSFGGGLSIGNPAFNPDKLFLAGEQGVWYDPSDFSTLYQDTSGSTPVTAVEQPVGMMLDKSGNGFHATAANNGTARPVLRARYNQLVYSEQFDDAWWQKGGVTITANDIAAPDGTTTADRMTETAATSTHRVSANGNNGTPIAANQTVTASCYYKKGTRDFGVISVTNSTGLSQGRAWFDLTNGVVGTVTNIGSGSGATASIVESPAGSGWYRCVLSCKPGVSSGNYYSFFGMAEADGSFSYLGDVTKYLYIWGAQLVANDVFPQNTYQRIEAAPTGNGAVTYATGADFPPYLAFDGVDDAMSTASINFSGTDEMSVFAGVTKNSDAGGGGMILELSAAEASNNGSFSLYVPGANTPRYASYVNGTLQRNGRRFVTYAAPITNVIAGALTTTAADSYAAIKYRFNGAANIGTSEADANSTGNFGNYPLYIGARNNSSLFFNGSLYSLIVRGKTSTATEITNTEAWVADKTGVTL